MQKALRRELKDKEQTILNAVDQARIFLADQPIEGPEEPRRSVHSKAGWKILSSCSEQSNGKKKGLLVPSMCFLSQLLDQASEFS